MAGGPDLRPGFRLRRAESPGAERGQGWGAPAGLRSLLGGRGMQPMTTNGWEPPGPSTTQGAQPLPAWRLGLHMTSLPPSRPPRDKRQRHCL